MITVEQLKRQFPDIDWKVCMKQPFLKIEGILGDKFIAYKLDPRAVFSKRIKEAMLNSVEDLRAKQ